MATSADALKEIKITQEEEQEEAIEWTDISEAIGYLEELKNFYNAKNIALRAVSLAQSKFANAHLWANKVRIQSKAIEAQAKSRELRVAEVKAIELAIEAERDLYVEVEFCQKLYNYIEKNEFDKAESLRLAIIKEANRLGKLINALKALEAYAEKLERHFIM